MRARSIYSRDTNTDPFQALAYVKAANTDAEDYFGYSLAMSADGNTLAVGAYGEDSAATGVTSLTPVSNAIPDDNNFAPDAGAVYVFSRVTKADRFEAITYVKAANTEAGDGFGNSLALSANSNTLAVGAFGEASAATGVTLLTPQVGGEIQSDNNDAPLAGAVYLYNRTASADSFEAFAYVKAANSGTGDWFGYALTLSADGNTLAVGASGEDDGVTIGVTTLTSASVVIPGYDNNALNSGAVYVFSRTISAAPLQALAYIKAPNSGAFDWFGSALALSSDGNTLAVGAHVEDSAAGGVITPPPVSGGAANNNDALESGAVYLY